MIVGMSTEKYVKAVVNSLNEKILKAEAWLNPANTPFSDVNYYPANDTSTELDVQDCQELIGW